MDTETRIIEATGNTLDTEYQKLLGSTGLFLVFSSDPQTAFGLDNEDQIVTAPYFRRPELVE